MFVLATILLPRTGHRSAEILHEVAGRETDEPNLIPSSGFFLFFFLPFFLSSFLSFFLSFLSFSWVCVAAHGLSLVGASGGCSSLWCSGSRCVGFSGCGTRAQ